MIQHLILFSSMNMLKPCLWFFPRQNLRTCIHFTGKPVPVQSRFFQPRGSTNSALVHCFLAWRRVLGAGSEILCVGIFFVCVRFLGDPRPPFIRLSGLTPLHKYVRYKLTNGWVSNEHSSRLACATGPQLQ